MPDYFPLDDYLLRKDELRRPLDWRHQRGMALSMQEPRRRIRRNGDDSFVTEEDENVLEAVFKIFKESYDELDDEEYTEE